MPPLADDTGRRLALLVACGTYQDRTLRALRAPGDDAAALADVLGSPSVGAFEVTTLADSTTEELLRGLATFCKQAGPSDLVLVYLSCHGVLDDRGRLYYASRTTDVDLLSATGVSSQWLNDQLDDCRARRKILVLDCCHSGAFAKGSKGESALALKDRFEGRGKVVLTASRATEYSFEGGTPVGDAVRSVFTRAMVDGLRSGDADRDEDGYVTVTDLYEHVHDTVRAAEPRQTPEMWMYGAEGDLVVAQSPRGPVIEPARLPEDLQVALESPRLTIRQSAVMVLAELLDTGDAPMALAAQQALGRIATGDHPSVARLAAAAESAAPGSARGAVEQAKGQPSATAWAPPQQGGDRQPAPPPPAQANRPPGQPVSQAPLPVERQQTAPQRGGRRKVRKRLLLAAVLGVLAVAVYLLMWIEANQCPQWDCL